MSSTFKGKIIEIRENQFISDTFQKRQFVVESVFEGQFGEKRTPVPFTLIQEKCAILDQYKVGQEVVVSYDFDSRIWLDKDTNEPKLDRGGFKQYFVDQRVWKLEAVAQADKPEASSASQVPPASGATGDSGFPGENEGPPVEGGDDGPDDLPF